MKLFREYYIGIAFRTKNTIENLLNRENEMYNKYDQCGVYELKCNSCPKVYIGQTGRNFKTRFKEHIQDIGSNRTKTGYSQHIINTGYEYSNVENTLNVLNVEKNGAFLYTLEKFHIYKTQKTDNLLNENSIDIYNPIFKLLL
jgi:predicted GIY-YIG superfamily endonuclease